MTIIYPLIMEAPPRLDLSDLDLSRLEAEGVVRLSNDLRRQLKDLAQFWNGHLASRNSPRPKQFRRRLSHIKESLDEAHAALNLNRSGASMWERHLLNWAANSGAEEATEFFDDVKNLLARMERMTALVVTFQEALPQDSGGRRSHEDLDFFERLASIFEKVGGRVSVYRSQHTDRSWIADTPFRRFAHAFYRLLPARLRRAQNGIDEALIAMVRKRTRAARKKG